MKKISGSMQENLSKNNMRLIQGKKIERDNEREALPLALLNNFFFLHSVSIVRSQGQSLQYYC